MRKVNQFCSLFFRGINKTRNSHIACVFYFVVCFEKTSAKCEIQKVYSWQGWGKSGIERMSGARGFQRLSCLWKSRLTLGLDANKITDYIKKRFK